MNALRRLEQGGIRFELTSEGKIAYENTWPGEVSPEWLQPLLTEIRANQDEVAMILKRRQEWIEVYDEWSEVLAADGEDPARDEAYLLRLKALAIAGRMPCYDGGQTDLGAEGWERITARLLANDEEEEESTDYTDFTDLKKKRKHPQITQITQIKNFS